MEAPPTRRSHEVKLPTGTGAIPVPTHAAPLPGPYQCGPLPSLSTQHSARAPARPAHLRADPLVQDGYTVELLPKLGFFTLGRPPSDGLASSGSQDSSGGRLPIGGPPPAEPVSPAEPSGGG